MTAFRVSEARPRLRATLNLARRCGAGLLMLLLFTSPTSGCVLTRAFKQTFFSSLPELDLESTPSASDYPNSGAVVLIDRMEMTYGVKGREAKGAGVKAAGEA